MSQQIVEHPVSELVIEAKLLIPGSPDWIKTSDKAIWVSNADRNEIAKIDAAAVTLERTVAVDQVPCCGLALGFGSVWVPSCGAATITPIDVLTYEPAARIAVRVADSEGAIACGNEAVWVPSEGGVLKRIDPVSRSVMATIAVGNGTFCATCAHGSVWVSNTREHVVVRIEEASNRIIARIPVGPAPRFLTSTEDAIWTLNQGDGTLSRIDIRRNEVVATIELGTPGAGGDIAAGLGAVWTTAVGRPLTRIDPDTNRVVVQYVGRGGDAITVGHGSVWICSYFLQELWRVTPPKL